MTSKYDRHFQGPDSDYLDANGLIELDAEDEAMQDVCMASAVPRSSIWKDRNNDKKIVAWDDEFEELLDHRTKQIDMIGRDKMRPWNLYKSFGLNWKNGFNFRQRIGDCYAHAWKNSLKASDLSTAFLNKKRPVEIYLEMLAAVARGNGRLAWGSGCNGAPMVKFGTEMGNWAASDLGAYDVGKSVSQANFNSPAFRANALKHQSIVVYVPENTFDCMYRACSAGYGIWTGESSYPTSAKRNAAELDVPASWGNGGHATAFTCAETIDSVRYLFFENSHGDKYGSGDRTDSPASGCWISETDFPKFRISSRYGQPFLNVGEMS